MSAHADGAGDADRVVIELTAAQTSIAAGIGRVVAAGERSGGLVDRHVLVGPIDPCGECDACRAGGAAVCPSAVVREPFSRRDTTAAARWLVPLGDGLELAALGAAAAAVAGDVALAYTLYARAGVGPREPVVVVGESPIARFLIEILIAKGVAPVAAAAPGSWADWIAARGVAVAADRASLSAAFTRQSLGTRPWRVICGEPAALAQAIALAGPRAMLTVLAGSAGAAIDGALAREVSIVGVARAHPDLVVEAAAMCVKGEIDLVAGTAQTPHRHRTHVHSFV